MLERLEQEEIQRLAQLEQDHQAQDTELGDANNSLWLRWTKWPTQFAGLPLDIITESAVQPERNPEGDYLLGDWAGTRFVSPVADEIRLQQLMQLLDSMFDRCNQTVVATSNLLCCWHHTATLKGYWPKPFKLPGKQETQQRYRSYWKQFICFAFRVWATNSPSGLRHQVYGRIWFSQQQQALMSRIWK